MADEIIGSQKKSSLLEKSYRQFDDLVNQGRLFYDPSSEIEYIEGEFRLQTTLVKAFKKKPWPGREIQGKPTHRADPFGDPEQAMIVMNVPDYDYVLQLNKYCAVRPQFLLHPRTFAPQEAPLTLQDFKALVHVRNLLNTDDFLAFYNCGVASGSSQPYRHIQITLKPTPEDFALWPDKAAMSTILEKPEPGAILRPPSHLHVPYLCSVTKASSLSGEELFGRYDRILHQLEGDIHEPLNAHNMIMTKDWLLVIPRRDAGKDREPRAPGANSMSMMGIVWLSDEVEKAGWERVGWADYLSKVGY